MNRKISCAVAVAAAAGAVSFAMPGTASAAPVSASNCARVATPSNPNGWGNTVLDEKGEAGKITSGVAGDSDGSLEFNTSASTERQASYHSAGSLPLADLNGSALTFQKSNGNANWQIRITGANTGTPTGFATLVWGAPVGAGKADATSSNQWWATRKLGNIPAAQNASLSALIAAANSDGKKAVVDLYGISSQPGGTADAKVNVDEVTFKGCTTNFKVSGGGNGSIEFPNFGS
ncbi:hypothetical protein [Gordonia sputi]|uniref:hypothetical protein n=1 Tax=Gordonia sputi TaxID=36823 RepID=UPI002271A19E|nr:hypothetical protein [Gordonia sputi]